jgi:hypothetical protein
MSRLDRRRSLGRVTTVTADRFTVELNANADGFTLVGFDGQHYVARIGSFVLIPLQDEYAVAEIIGLRESERQSAADGDLKFDDGRLLASTKFLDVVPLGTLPFDEHEAFKFGLSVYPALFSDVLYTQTEDLDRILDVTTAVPIDGFSTGPTKTQAFPIGTSVVFDDYQVKVRVNEFFGGHSAVLGNTGSGKSCTVAAILQSVFEKPDEHAARGASFVILDTNGEYRRAFSDLPDPIRRLYAPITGAASSGVAAVQTGRGEDYVELRLPHWFMTIDEWAMLLRASDRAQLPVLRMALGLTSLFSQHKGSLQNPDVDALKSHLLGTAVLTILQQADGAPSASTRIKGMLANYYSPDFSRANLDSLLAVSYGQLSRQDALVDFATSKVLDSAVFPEYDNSPFDFADLGEALGLAILYEESHGNKQIRDYCSSLITRFNSVRDRPDFQFLRPNPAKLAAHEISPEAFVDRVLGNAPATAAASRSQITIVDMNDVEDEIVQISSAIIGRLIFERLRRNKRRNTMPVNLILEEAHRYIGNAPSIFAIDATPVFERVAKEGRKYGFFIILASQRPSELSRTVLSQCSNYVVHRIQNPEDLSHIRQMTPFISENVLKRLPSLPKQHALIFGSSVNVPTTFRVREASPRPHSDDADISDLWFVPARLLEVPVPDSIDFAEGGVL